MNRQYSVVAKLPFWPAKKKSLVKFFEQKTIYVSFRRLVVGLMCVDVFIQLVRIKSSMDRISCTAVVVWLAIRRNSSSISRWMTRIDWRSFRTLRRRKPKSCDCKLKMPNFKVHWRISTSTQQATHCVFSIGFLTTINRQRAAFWILDGMSNWRTSFCGDAVQGTRYSNMWILLSMYCFLEVEPCFVFDLHIGLTIQWATAFVVIVLLIPFISCAFMGEKRFDDDADEYFK